MRFLLCQLCLLVLVLNSISAQVNNSRSCERHCGNISIPYPFGIGRGCFLDEWYEVQCNNSVPFLPKIRKEVVQIDLPGAAILERGPDAVPFGFLRVKTKIVSMGCDGRGDGKEVLDFTETPFSISIDNKLVAFGCNHTATLMHVEPRIVGCVSSCHLSYLSKGSTDECAGYQCCSASTPRDDFFKVIGVKIESNDSGSNRCAVAFLTDELAQPSLPWDSNTSPEWFHERKYSTIQLEWQIQTRNLLLGESLGCGTINPEVPVTLNEFQSRPCYCGRIQRSDISDDIGYLKCACTNGYEGNPYDVQGCKVSSWSSTS
ncbi:unnamed protein product [Microthlaspi erraticum]|uniref:Wall-associated receptor kinase galacturonan-binding domain-containing protein n=1 Tax=Microthlaspi erraticum TaxID=1685480 RepID=A0A6D2L3U1_9BRAS|nr:unnamed protein product [Microthlaspi erraticum]